MLPITDEGQSTMLSIGEVAAMLHTYPEKLRRYEAAGRIPKARRTEASSERVWTSAEIPAIRILLSLGCRP